MAEPLCNLNTPLRLLSLLNNSFHQWQHACKRCTSVVRCHRTCFKADYSYINTPQKGIYSPPKVKNTWNPARDRAASRWMNKMSETEQDKLRYVQLEYELWKAEGRFEVPCTMGNADWMNIMSCRDEAERLYMYSEIKQSQEMWLKEKLQDNKEKQEVARLDNEISDTILQDRSSIYFNSRLFRQKTEMQEKSNEMRGWTFGRPVVFDLSGDKYLPSLMKSLSQILKINQQHPEPCCVHLTGCGISQHTQSREIVSRLIGDFTFLQHHEETLSEVFPKDKLVIVTNTSQNLLEDSSTDIPVFMLQQGADIKQFAEDRGIRHAFLPLHKYIKLPRHHRNMFRYTLPQTIQVLLDMDLTHNWVHALLNNMPEEVARHCHTVKDVVHYIQTTKREHQLQQKQKIPW